MTPPLNVDTFFGEHSHSTVQLSSFIAFHLTRKFKWIRVKCNKRISLSTNLNYLLSTANGMNRSLGVCKRHQILLHDL